MRIIIIVVIKELFNVHNIVEKKYKLVIYLNIIKIVFIHTNNVLNVMELFKILK